MLDPQEWSLMLSVAVVRRHSGYAVAQRPMLLGQDGLTVQAPLFFHNADQPGELERYARDTVDRALRSAESIQNQEPRRGPESVNVVQIDAPSPITGDDGLERPAHPHAQTQGYVRRQPRTFSQRMGLADPTGMELWRD